MIAVYRIMCLANNKNYIGITADLAHRLVVHFNEKSNRRRSTLLARAIRKYGKDNFQVFVLEEVKTWEEAWAKERYYIQLYDTYKVNGYNMTLGGEGQPGLVHSEKTRRQMAESHRGKSIGPNNPMYGKPSAMRGKKWSKESRDKLAASCKGRIPWNKGKKCPQLAGENNGFFGKKHTSDSIERARKSRSWYKPSDETRFKQSMAHKGKPNRITYTPEIRLKMSESAKLRGSNTKGLKWSEESKHRASIARKIAWASGVYENRKPKNKTISKEVI